ncbi:hypothetical protein PSECIP111854_02175 [Pseudoalteromonas sp. CIP111854]|uniref:Uncharacterized protein n=1 Tax=Pseudoalteromonas holothuriae TaxID=2963714 RepID=A0A9W4QXZ7_9GAMM|nr:hypothetical protein [Pseudoalteromonas sp. CIP111854]CAH9058302.1 hypothetical protein PSECIP111854_02175 [Pseudoalteromonas sp. CIP111854]
MNVLGYVLFLPFIYFYSFILGQVLKCALIPGGLCVLMLIMGPKEFFKHMKLATQTQTSHKPAELT